MSLKKETPCHEKGRAPMNNKMRSFLKRTFNEEEADSILSSYSTLLEAMVEEQKEILSPSQYKLAKNRILKRIALYRSVKPYFDDAEALEYAKEYFYPQSESARRMLKLISRSNAGCTLFQKSFVQGLKADTWVSTIRQNDKDALIYDVTKCLYKDLCDFYASPALCSLFCDGDWLMFGDLKKLKFERRYTLGQGGEVCDFVFTRRRSHD